MLFIDHIIQALQTLISNKLRSFLSILGLVIWVMSVTVMISVVEGLQSEILDQLSDVSKSTISVVAGKSFNPFNPQRSQEFPWFAQADIDYLSSSMPMVYDILPWSQISEDVFYKGTKINLEQMAGVTVGMWEIESVDITHWRWLIENDITENKNVLVVSSNFIDSVFDWEEPIWQELIIANQTFVVVWVTEQASVWFFEPLVAYMPVSTAQIKILNDPFYQYMVLKVDIGSDLEYAIQLAQYLLLKRTGAEHIDDAQFQVISTSAFVDQFVTITSSLQLAAWGIWAIALLVWGIWVMNIMLVSVTERTREIWIRKAIWAKNRDIMIQFLTESIMLWLFWCLLWVLVSRWIILLLQYFDIPALLNMKTLTVAVTFSLAIGIIFGVGPARKAAGLKPIDALRFE